MSTRRTVALIGSSALLLAAASAASPQRAERPRISPHESVSATVNGTRIEIVYGRPAMRGRTIFGGLVPYGRVWCPGADEATTLDSTRALQIGSLRVPAGPHTIWMLPTVDRWTLIVSREPSGFHTQYNPRADLGRVELQNRALASPIERLTFRIEPTPTGGRIAMSFENIEVSVPFSLVR